MATRNTPKRKNSNANSRPPPGFRSPIRPHAAPIDQMSARELHDLHRRNAHILAAEPGTSTSSYHGRMTHEQAQIENRLIEVEDVPQLNEQIRTNLTINPTDDSMDTAPDYAYSPSQSPTRATSTMIEAKRRALARMSEAAHNTGQITNLDEAIDMERQAHQADLERKAHLEEKRRQRGYTADGQMSEKERETRMLAFLNHKPTDSDLDDDSDYDPDDDDPATWFDDQDDDGVKGQDIIEPDDEDYSDIIRVDSNRVHAYSTFYEPRDPD